MPIEDDEEYIILKESNQVHPPFWTLPGDIERVNLTVNDMPLDDDYL